MEPRDLMECGAAFLIALTVGSLVEYVIHRLMHIDKVLGRRHAEHHQEGHGQGWFGEFKDYVLPAPLIAWLGFLYSLPAGIGFAGGCILFAGIAAYAHQVQHENPELVFWLRRPVHHLHHKHAMWRHNFGISVDVWDRVFRTYKQVDWKPEKRPSDYPLRSYAQIKWF